MTLPVAPNAISLGNIQTEFGGTNPIPISEYYGSGGAPGSGEISIGDFHGLSATTVTVSPINEVSLVFSGSATAGFRINTDGTIDRNLNGAYSQINASTDWIIPNGDASSLYEFMISSYTGDAWTTSPTANGNWIGMGANREWTLVAGPGVESKSNSFTLNVRYNGGATIDTAVGCDITAERA